MTDEFQTGICSANWWSSGRNISSLPCSTTLTDVGSFEWPNEIEMKATRSCEDSVSVSCNSMVYQDTQRPQESDSIGGGGSGGLVESTLHMMGYNLSSPTPDWNQAAFASRNSGRTFELNLASMLQEDLSSRSNFQQESGLDSSHDEKDWSPKNYSDGGEDPSINQVFVFENSGDCKVNSQGLPMSYPIVSASTILPGLYEPDQSQQPSYCMMNYPSPTNHNMDLNEISPSLPQFLKSSSSPKCQYDTNQLHFSNNTLFWNASADVRSTQYLASTFKDDSNCGKLTRKLNNEEVVRESISATKRSSEPPTFKRPRIETPSPLPTFKVRKEKLGDRVTALQQLVSPFGKTDTASVLFEAIEYIKFLHEQVGVLSTPYMKNGAPVQVQHHQHNSDQSEDVEGLKKDLTSRGLCLVPISSTFPVTNETTADFWTPTFGGSYR